MKKTDKAEAKAEEDVIVPAKELVISMAPAFFTREQVIELLDRVRTADANGLTVRFV